MDIDTLKEMQDGTELVLAALISLLPGGMAALRTEIEPLQTDPNHSAIWDQAGQVLDRAAEYLTLMHQQPRSPP